MRRSVLFSATVLLATLGADGTPAGCGPIKESPEIADGGTADDGGTPDLSTGGGSSGKVPHLISIATGEDLGTLVDLRTLTVFSEKVNALVVLGLDQPTAGVYIYFSKTDCNGNQYIVPTTPTPPVLTNMIFIMGPEGTYLQQVGAVVPALHAYSKLKQADARKLDGVVVCENIDMLFTNQLVQYADTHVKVRPPDNQLKVELR